MPLDSIKDGLTVVAACVGAVAGVWNLYLSFRGKKDRFIVKCDSAMPSDDRETMLHVISKSDHVIRISDYGFIMANGSLHSLPMDDDVRFADGEIIGRGDLELVGFNSVCERGMVIDVNTIGVYARLVGASRPRLAFKDAATLYDRMKVRCRLLFRPRYFLWRVK